MPLMPISDAERITAFCNAYPKHTQQDGSPSKHSPIGSSAYSFGGEAGYDVFSIFDALRQKQKLYVFGRYEDYNTYATGNKKVAYTYDHVKRMSFGINYKPIPQIIVKAEWAKRYLDSAYNDEPSISLGVMFVGWFNRK